MASLPRVRLRSSATAVVVAGLVAFVLPTGASAQSISQTKAEIAALSAQLNAETQQSERDANKYDAAEAQLHAATAAVQSLQYAIARKRAQIAATSAVLVKDAVRAFVDGASVAQVESLFNQNIESSDARSLFAALAVGNLDGVRSQLEREQASLAQSVNQAAQARGQVIAQTQKMHALLLQNQALQYQTQHTLNVVTAQLRQQIITYEIAAGGAAARARNQYAEEQAVNTASQVGGQAAANKVLEAIAANTPPVITTGGGGSGAGTVAVHAAISQLGVPYVWGGETPGQGFDCSGLVQWAWSRAGVSIPRTTQEEWKYLPHVSMNNLQPGDLIFYYNLDGDNAVDHVIMYVGSGPWGSSTIIQAAHSGTNIAYSPLWTFGLIGAARP